MARGHAIGSMVFNKPQLIALDELQPIVSYLSSPDKATSLRLNTDKEELVELKLEDFDSQSLYQRAVLGKMGINPDTMVGTLDISGALMYRKGSMGADCTELTSYEGLKRQTEDMVEAGAKTIVLKVDSGGGMAYGLFSAANYIKKTAKQAGVKTVAYVDGSAYSAAFGLAVLADEVVVNPQASVGSVGVVVALYNDTKSLEKMGVSRQFVFAGDNKIPFDNLTGEFTEKFVSELQKSVNKTYQKFVSHISSHRGLSEQTIIDTQASVYDADEAITLGLVDRIMELEDFEIEYGLKKSKGAVVESTSTAMLSDNSHSKREGTMKVTPEVDELLSDAHTKTTDQSAQSMSEDTSAQMLELQQENVGLTAKLSELTTKLEESNSAVEKLTADFAKVEQAHRTEQREAKLEIALGKDNEGISELLENTESLSDVQFDVMVKSMSNSQEEKQVLLAELGGEGKESNVQLTLSEQIAKTAQAMNSRKA